MNSKIIIVLIALLILTGCEKEDVAPEKAVLQSIYVEKEQECKKEAEIYHVDSTGKRYFTKCINEINIILDNEEVSLKTALENNQKIMEEIINKMTLVDVVYDGGTKIYKDYGNSIIVYSDEENPGLTLIKCNALQGSVTEELPNNQDYYFGDLDLEYEQGYCSSLN